MEAACGSICPACKTTGTLTCTGCRNVKYCSIECQQADWVTHKLLCKSFKDVAERPSKDMARCIFFPPNGSKPEFVWLPVKDYKYGSTLLYKAPDLTVHMGAKTFAFTVFLKNPITDVPLEYRITLYYDDDFLSKYSTTNKAVLKATSARIGQDWRGPVLACRGISASLREFDKEDIIEIMDMDMRSYSDVVACIIDYFNHEPIHQLRAGPKIEAVKMHCDGDRKFHNKSTCEKVMIPASHFIFESEILISPISQRIGMPLYTLKYPHTKEHDECGYSVNQGVTFMHSCIDPIVETNVKKDIFAFGFANMYWQTNVGNVLLVRQDRKPLDPDVAEAFAMYCQFHLGAFFQWQGESDGEEPGDGHKETRFKKAVLDEVTTDNFATYLSQCRDVQAKYPQGPVPGGVSNEGIVADMINGKPRMGLSPDDRDRIIDRLLHIGVYDQAIEPSITKDQYYMMTG